MSTVHSPVESSTTSNDRVKIRTALLSVYDKTGVVDLAEAITRLGGKLLASGGTATALEEAGLDVESIESYAGLAAGFGGRVKTLHPKIHAGILARRNVAKDLEELEEGEALPIDLVCVNLYPFEAAVAAGASEAERIEKIDIGGPAMIRAAAKNWQHVVVICDPADVDDVVDELNDHGGTISRETRKRLAAKAFARTSAYDAAIFAELSRREESEPGALPEHVSLFLHKVRDLRYGENPHQGAALYSAEASNSEDSPGGWHKIRGVELSYNNWIDLVAAAELACAFDDPAAVVVKHTNPCGTAVGSDLKQAWERALAGDPVSAFGGIAAFNRELDGATAQEMSSLFLEVVVAPSFADEAREALAKKKRLRLVEVPEAVFGRARHEWKALPGGVFLLQDDAGEFFAPAEWETKSGREPTESELRDLEFAWKVVGSVKSNAIVFVRDQQLLGVGAGQMSRVDSVRIAIEKAHAAGHDLEGSVVGSDAFFPFADGPRLALEAGARAIVHPGGSKRDEETIQAVNEVGAALVFSGRRVFRH